MKSDWIWMVVGALIGGATGFAAAFYGAQHLPWALLMLAFSIVAVAGWLVGKRLVRRVPADFGADLKDGAMKMVLIFLESGFRALPIVAWLIGLWIGSAVGAEQSAGWAVGLGVAAWPLVTALIFAAKVAWQDWTRPTIKKEETKID